DLKTLEEEINARPPTIVQILDEDVSKGRCTAARRADCLDQIQFYLDNLGFIKRQYANRAIAIANHHIFTGSTQFEAEQAADRAYPGRGYFAIVVHGLR